MEDILRQLEAIHLLNLSGINNKFKIIGFVITSLLVGVAGIILASLMDTGQQGSAKGLN